MKFLIILFLSLAAVIISLSIYLQPDSFALCPDNGNPSTREGCKPVDAIIAISGGDTLGRTRHAVELYQEGWAPLLIFSGAAQDKSGPSNALAMRRAAIDAGVPSSAILIEENAENTEQNAANTNRLLELNSVSKVILVTSGYHQRRANLEFHRMLDKNITIQNSPTSDKDWGWFWWLTPRGWWLAIGEFVKIIAFYAGAH